jgi:hypothetical protein
MGTACQGAQGDVAKLFLGVDLAASGQHLGRGYARAQGEVKSGRTVPNPGKKPQVSPALRGGT